MFERFSERAREAVVLAQEEARTLGHAFIGAEHLLLGCVRVRAAGGLSEREVRSAVVEALGRAPGPVEGQIPFTSEAIAALNRSAMATRGSIGPAQVLAALLEGDAVAAIVARSGADVARLREEVAAVSPVPSEPVEVRLGDELLGDLGNPRTDVRMIGAILRRDSLAAGWLRTAGIDEDWVSEFGGG